MAIDFPNSPSVGQMFQVGEKTWIWDGTSWGARTFAGTSFHAATHGVGESDAVTIAQSQVTGLTSSLALKAPLSSPTFTGGVSFNDGTNVEGRLTAASGAFYIQGGTSSVDTSGLVTVARNSTTSTNISSFKVYADSTTISGALYSGPVIVGNTSGNVGLSINDGYGNANVFFNHYAGVPDVTGNSGRISVNVDTTTGASMTFSIKSGTTSGTAVALTTPLYLYETYAQFYGTVVAPASTTTLAPLRIPHGTAPTTPTNGDVWTTTLGLYAQVNGATVGPFGSGGGSASKSTIFFLGGM